ncbi:MAG: hypothetical protein Ct9H300mP25_10060 [Acidobacteriota bacterium]|nr:MAG: hypothetical protein Ct9H300mP25_10060 [Acidobacteriota bacterium]
MEGPIQAGYSGPAVAGGRVFVTDFEMTNGMRGTERALALDENQEKNCGCKSGRLTTRDPVGGGSQCKTDGGWRSGVCAWSDGCLSALKVDTGELLWRKSYAETTVLTRVRWGFDWGFASAPLVDGDRLIALWAVPRRAWLPSIR